MRRWLVVCGVLLVLAFGIAAYGVLWVVRETGAPKQTFEPDRPTIIRTDPGERKMIWVHGTRPASAECTVRDRRRGTEIPLRADGRTNTTSDDGHWEALYSFDSGSGDLAVSCELEPAQELAVWNALDARWFVGVLVRLFAIPGVVGLVGIGFGLIALRVHLRDRIGQSTSSPGQ